MQNRHTYLRVFIEFLTKVSTLAEDELVTLQRLPPVGVEYHVVRSVCKATHLEEFAVSCQSKIL